MEIQLLKAQAESGELLAAYTEWYGDNDDELWCYISASTTNGLAYKEELFFLFADYGSMLFQLDNTATAIASQYKKSWNDDDELIWEPTSSIEEPEQMPKHTSIFRRLSEYANSSSQAFVINDKKDNQMNVASKEYLECNKYIWEGGESSLIEIWKTPKNNVQEIDFILEKISEATSATSLPLRKLAETNEDAAATEEGGTHEIFLAYRDKDPSFEEDDLLWLIITIDRPDSDALYALVRSSVIGQGQQIDKLIKYTNGASTILLADSTGDLWLKQLEISDKTKQFTEVRIGANQSWSEEDTSALQELNRQCCFYMENVNDEDYGSYFKPRINKLSLLEQVEVETGGSGDHQIIKLATPGFDDEILANLLECEDVLL